MDTNTKKVDPVAGSKSDPQVEPQPVAPPPAEDLTVAQRTADALTAARKTVASLTERMHYLEQRLADAEQRLLKQVSSGPKIGDQAQGGTVVHATPESVVIRGGDPQEWITPTSG